MSALRKTSVTILLLTLAPLLAAQSATQLVQNPNLTPANDGKTIAPWKIEAPAYAPAACRARPTDRGLLIDSPQNNHAVTFVTQTLNSIKSNQPYAIEAICKIKNLAAPYHSLLVRITWTKNAKPLHPAGMLVNGPITAADTARFSDILIAPDNVDGAIISLESKWLGHGAVTWKTVTITPTTPPPPRKARIGTVYLRPKNSTPQKNMQLWCDQIDAAGRLKLDIICLGELIEVVGTSASTADIAKPIPGPATEILAEAARRNNIYVVAGLAELEGKTIYNTAVLIDRKGKLAGKYRKIHLPREEWKKGVTPGRDYPVFKTDFATIAIQICYDWFFPESAEIFALKGAEILFSPTWGNTLPDEDGCIHGESTFRVRARDNGLYIVPCVYDGSSMVIDPRGRILTSNNGQQGLFFAEVDLNKRETSEWTGYLPSILPRHRMPNTYDQLTQPQEAPAP